MANNKKGLALAGDVLKEIAGDIVISRIALQRAEGIELIRTNREQGRQPLAYSTRPFVLCGLPIRRPPKDVLLHERRNGRFLLQVTGHPDFGLPYGQDRLIPILLATMAYRRKTPILTFGSAAEMLDLFGLAKSGEQYRRLTASLERVFGSSIFFRADVDRPVRLTWYLRFHFLKEARLWYSRDPTQRLLAGDEFANRLVLDPDFYEELMRHPIPADLDAIKMFTGAPALLDLYMWLAYRCFTATREERIPLFGPYGLTAQLGSAGYTRERRFRQKLDQWLTAIREVWPECPAVITPDGQSLAIDHGEAVRPSPRP
jgi:hypothetical protein